MIFECYWFWKLHSKVSKFGNIKEDINVIILVGVDPLLVSIAKHPQPTWMNWTCKCVWFCKSCIFPTDMFLKQTPTTWRSGWLLKSTSVLHLGTPCRVIWLDLIRFQVAQMEITSWYKPPFWMQYFFVNLLSHSHISHINQAFNLNCLNCRWYYWRPLLLEVATQNKTITVEASEIPNNHPKCKTLL